VQALTRAVQDSPDDPRLLARLAIARNDAEESDTGLDEQLRRAARLDPFDSDILMTLGLREEFEGDRIAAERELVRAAEVDHQFKPAWTLANFYSRHDEPAKAWGMIKRILALDPLGFDLAPVFDLSWRLDGDNSARIADAIPKYGPKPVQYLAFLMATNRADAALRFWPAAIGAVRQPGSAGTDKAIEFPDFLVRADRVAESVNAWNQLVDTGTIQSGHLDPARGQSIADPEFRFPAAAGFSWHIDEINGVSANIYSGALHLELNDDEPESFRILSAIAPLIAGRRYRLLWKADNSGLNDHVDPGFRFRITEGGVTKECPPLLTAHDCKFSSDAGNRMVSATVSLEYTRALGTTRVTGTLDLSGVRLELMP
jgi:hypothetical protein